MSKLRKDNELSLALAKTRENEKVELGIAHERLVDDHEKLEKEFMSLKEIHEKLTKSRDQLLAQYSNKQVMSPSPTSINIMSRNSCATTNFVGSEKVLNDVINSQRVKSGKEGLGRSEERRVGKECRL